MKKYKFGKKEFLLLACSSFIFLLASDVVLKHLLPPVYQATKYGWTAPENFTKKKTVEDSPGKFRSITVEYFKNGFKRWGDLHTTKTKMLILGDSVTEMNWVSNGEEWFSSIEKEFKNLELFVCGGGGYGSLQEYLVLDDVIDQIHPQIILIQFSDNDFGNNLYDLDLRGYPYNNHAIRPYLENDQIVYRLPLPFAKIRARSFVADRILAVYDRLVWDQATKNLKAYLDQQRVERSSASPVEKARIDRLQKQAFAVTGRIYEMIRARAHGVPVYIFNSSDDPRVDEICRLNHFVCISGIKKELDSKQKQGFWVELVNNRHWNKLGNQIVGQKLVEYFKNVESLK